MNITKYFNHKNYKKAVSISFLCLTLWVQGCNNKEINSNMKLIEEKDEEEFKLKNNENINLSNNHNKSLIFSYLKNIYTKLNPLTKNINPKSRIILGCGQKLDTKKHNHKGFWTVDPDKSINPDYIGSAEGALQQLNDNSCISILSEYLPFTTFTPKLFKLVSQKLQKGKEFTILGTPLIMVGKNKTILIPDFKKNIINIIDFPEVFEGKNIKINNTKIEIGNNQIEELLNHLEMTDNIEKTLEAFKLNKISEEDFDYFFIKNYNLKLSKKTTDTYTNKEIIQTLQKNQTNPSIGNIFKLIYYACIGNCCPKSKMVFTKI